ncbi:MAG: hypothetical protein RMJ52_17625 [Gemmataceae bacterium]|nr:hypothetical protein [Gemmataceae bacterium]
MFTNKQLLTLLVLVAIGSTFVSLWQLFSEKANAVQLAQLSSGLDGTRNHLSNRLDGVTKELAAERQKSRQLESQLAHVRKSLEDTQRRLDMLVQSDLRALRQHLTELEEKSRKLEKLLSKNKNQDSKGIEE